LRIKQEKKQSARQMAVPIFYKTAAISAITRIGESIFFFPLAVLLMENF